MAHDTSWVTQNMMLLNDMTNMIKDRMSYLRTSYEVRIKQTKVHLNLIQILINNYFGFQFNQV